MKKIKLYFLRKIKVKRLKCRLLQFLFGALRMKVLFHSTKISKKNPDAVQADLSLCQSFVF